MLTAEADLYLQILDSFFDLAMATLVEEWAKKEDTHDVIELQPLAQADRRTYCWYATATLLSACFEGINPLEVNPKQQYMHCRGPWE